MDSDVKPTEPSPGDAKASDWENRRLCSDENCIGVIGPGGRCKECGKPEAGEPEATHLPIPPDPAPPAQAPDAPSVAEEAASADDGWENRRLCSDENCIGVIGPGGRCTECGKPFAG